MERQRGYAASRTPFVGRGRELATLLAGLDPAAARRGHLYLVSGEPGIGKTRLLEELAAAAVDRGAVAVWGRCREGDDTPPMWPWTQIVRTLLTREEAAVVDTEVAARASHMLARTGERLIDPPAPPPVAGESAQSAADAGTLERAELHDDIGALLGAFAARRPLVLLLDDLHAADPPTLHMLQSLTRAPGTPAVLVVATYREPLGRRTVGAVAARLAELLRDGTGVALRGLDVPATRQLIGASGVGSPSEELVRTLHEATGGNPFFLDEVVRLLMAEGRLDDATTGSGRLGVPDRVRSAVQLRLAPLAPGSRAVLEVAAVVGQRFDQALLATVLDVPSQQVHAALTASLALGVVQPAFPKGFRFAHDVVRQTIYHGLTPARRAQLHCRIGAALEVRHAGDLKAVLPALAQHFLRGQPESDPARALTYARRAGEQALENRAHEDAAVYFRQALAVVDRVGALAAAAERGTLLLGLARAAVRAGDPARAEQAIRDAADEARRLGSVEMLAQAALMSRVGAGGEGAGPARVTLLEEALAEVGELNQTLRACLLARLARALDPATNAARRDALSREALSVARRIDHPATLAAALASRCAAIGEMPDEERVPLAAELLELAGEMGDGELAIEAYHWQVIDGLAFGDLAAVDTAMAAAADLAERLRQPHFRWWCGLWSAMRAMVAGRFAESERQAGAARAIGERVQPIDAARWHSGQTLGVLWLRGEAERVVSLIGGWMRDQPTPVPQACAGQAWAMIGAGRLEDARRVFEALAADDFGALAPAQGGLHALAALAETCAALGDVRRAATLYDLIRPWAGRAVVLGPAVACCGPADRFLGLLAAVRGEWETAEAHFATALALSQRLASPPFVCLTQYQLAVMLMTRGRLEDRARAEALLAEARFTAERLGMRAVTAPAATPSTPASVPPGSTAAAARAAGESNALVREGECWTFYYGGAVCSIVHRAGMAYLAMLLRQPHQSIPALQLVAGAEADEIPALDEGFESAAPARRAGSPAERARVRVTRALREMIERIRGFSPALGEHLARSVRTGTACVYAPSEPTAWTVSRDPTTR